jgi:isoleucyl-tRNA synthetase
VFKANASVVEVLTERGALLHHKVFNHLPALLASQDPDHLPCHPQWFISMEQKGLRKRALEEIERIEKEGIAEHGQSGWVPAWGKNRIQAMVENRPDWCISRQRTWACPSPVRSQGYPGAAPGFRAPDGRGGQAGRAVRHQAWWDLDKAELLGVDADNYEKVPDTLDVWFDSGSTHASVVDAVRVQRQAGRHVSGRL